MKLALTRPRYRLTQKDEFQINPTAKYFEESVDQEESISSYLDKIMFDFNDLQELKAYADSLD